MAGRSRSLTQLDQGGGEEHEMEGEAAASATSARRRKLSSAGKVIFNAGLRYVQCTSDFRGSGQKGPDSNPTHILYSVVGS